MTPATAAVCAASPVTIRTDVSSSRWDAFVASQASASTYHFSAWTRIVERAFGHETCRLAAECDGEIVGVLPIAFFDSWMFGRFTISMPFLNYGGILATFPDARRTLLDAAVAETQRHGGGYLELRHTERLCPGLMAKSHKVAMVLPLARTDDEQWQGLDRKVRNQVRKAEKSGVVVAEGGARLLADFYAIFARNMRDLGTPVYSAGFFSEVLRELPEHSKVFCATVGGVPVAASLVVWQGNRIEVPWASSLREFNPTCANVLLYWQMLRFAISRGFTRFDFGRSTPNEGTYQFKQQWGAEPHPMFWEYWLSDHRPLPDRGPTNPRFSLARAAWSRLPVPLTRVIGPPIVRNIP